MAKAKTDRFVRTLNSNRNVSDEQRKATHEWLVGLGVPEETARHHDFAQRCTVKRAGNRMFVSSTYTAGIETSPQRTFLVNGVVVAEVSGGRNNCWNKYETFGKGSLETDDGEDCWLRDSGVRDFDRVAHSLIRTAVAS